MKTNLIRIKTVMAMTGKSRSAIYADMAAETFPASVSIGARSIAWSEELVRSWISMKLLRKATKYPKQAPLEEKGYAWELGDI